LGLTTCFTCSQERTAAYVLGAGLGTISFLRLSASLGRSVFPAGNLLKLRM